MCVRQCVVNGEGRVSGLCRKGRVGAITLDKVCRVRPETTQTASCLFLNDGVRGQSTKWSLGTDSHAVCKIGSRVRVVFRWEE